MALQTAVPDQQMCHDALAILQLPELTAGSLCQVEQSSQLTACVCLSFYIKEIVVSWVKKSHCMGNSRKISVHAQIENEREKGAFYNAQLKPKSMIADRLISVC